MKANEMPEKIYLFNYNDAMVTPLEGDTTYVKEDAFIEKALKWYCLDCECNDNCKDTKCFFYREFERYLEGGTNALPPKISGRILDEDGSTSDDWRYRHFTSKMQDAFIEKACKGIEHLLSGYIIRNFHSGDSYDDDKLIEDFKNYMEGE